MENIEMKDNDTLTLFNRCQLISGKIAQHTDSMITLLFALREKMEELEKEIEKLKIENQELKIERAKIPRREPAKTFQGKSIE